jgi:transposase-like protein
MSILSEPYFHNEDAAFEHLEQALWPEGPVCPHCGVVGHATKLQGEKHRRGVWKCNEKECRKQFTVKVGTVFEHGRMPLHKMLQAVYLMCASKKGMSAHQLHRTLGITYKTAWFLAHRIREAMREGKLGQLGGAGKIVEIDETYVGGKDKNKHSRKRRGKGGMDKEIVFALVERGGKVRSHHVPSVNAKTLRPLLKEQLAEASRLMSDDGGARVGREFPNHEAVNHSINEYVRGDVHTNTIEGYFSIMKRGISGVYHHVSQKHLRRYLAEFDFRYNERAALGVNDLARTRKALSGIAGKRMTYRDSLARRG